MGRFFKIKRTITPFMFFFGFILPLLIFFVVYRTFVSSSVFFKKVYVRKSFSARIPGESIRIFDDDKLNPLQGSDFILNLWVKFRNLPKGDERTVLLTKYDADSAYKQGYAVAVDKASTGFRGSVFWQDINNNGRWYTFDEIPLIVGSWFMFTVSFTSNEHLAFYYTYSIGEKIFTKLIGGYKVTALPASKSSFRVGSLVSQLFDGKIGTVSIINTKNIESHLSDVIKESFLNSQVPPKRFKEEEISLWLLGGEDDIGKNHFQVEKIGKRKKKEITVDNE